MSNTRTIDLAKLAEVMRGQLPAGVRPVPHEDRGRSRPSFPRVSADRINELIDDDQDDEMPGISARDRLRFRAMLPGTAPHVQGRPQASNGTAAA